MNLPRNIYLFISLLLMLGLLVILVITGNLSERIQVDRNLFRVDDLTRIDRVLLQSPGQTLSLKYNGAKWMVNDSLEADSRTVQVFFATLLQAEPTRPVAQRQRDSLQTVMKEKGIKVSLFEGGALQKSFYVFGHDARSESYYLLSEDTQPYVVAIPGYRVYVAAIFTLAPTEWREKRLFNFNWQNFKSLTATFPASPRDNFSISFKDNYFGLDGNPEADTTKLNDYLDAVSLIRAARFVEKGERKYVDSLVKTAPQYHLEVSDIANRTYRLNVYGLDEDETFVVATFSNGQALLLRREDASRIAHPRGYFSR
jgi:hypothetical protein